MKQFIILFTPYDDMIGEMNERYATMWAKDEDEVWEFLYDRYYQMWQIKGIAEINETI